jgi:hypothetical protein
VTAGDLVAGGLIALAVALIARTLQRRRWRRVAQILHDNHRAIWTRPAGWTRVDEEDPEPWREPLASSIAGELSALGFTRLGYIEDAGNPLNGGEQRRWPSSWKPGATFTWLRVSPRDTSTSNARPSSSTVR